jgi:hypothetical protein
MVVRVGCVIGGIAWRPAQGGCGQGQHQGRQQKDTDHRRAPEFSES